MNEPQGSGITFPMSELLQAATTTGNRHDAERIATELVDRHLAACVQICGPIHSTYRWQGQVENSEEWLCVAKTSREKIAAIESLLSEIHPYDVPELIATPIVEASEAYAKWLRDELGES